MTIPRRALLVLPGLAALAAVVAACSPEEKGGIPITGTLNSAVGGSAELTIGDTTLGTGFNLSATLDGEVVTGTGAWRCYAPLPPEYTNFDIEASDGSTFGFFLSIDPAVWSTGAHAIGDQVRLLVAAPDRFGAAQTGSIVITKAAALSPDTPGNDCGFSVAGPIDLVGEKDR